MAKWIIDNVSNLGQHPIRVIALGLKNYQLSNYQQSIQNS